MRRRLVIGIGFLVAALGLTVLALGPPSVSPEAIRASVDRSQAHLDIAWRLPVAATFGRDLAWQSNASLCGPASIANVRRSLGEPSATEADVLAGTGLCRSGYCILGLTLDELADLARKKTGRKITVLRDLTADAFREHMRFSNDPSRRYIVNFSRERIFGAGVGHHSPVGGYLEAEDRVFVLDVSRDFQPWLIERSRLFSAMDTLDGDRKRGLLLIE